MDDSPELDRLCPFSPPASPSLTASLLLLSTLTGELWGAVVWGRMEKTRWFLVMNQEQRGWALYRAHSVRQPEALWADSWTFIHFSLA